MKMCHNKVKKKTLQCKTFFYRYAIERNVTLFACNRRELLHREKCQNL